ncbi:MAG: crossover junction endodeoxyribonuclease RuvC [Candidatus Harrisonbacteria bacterium RIFCSPLOWO2_02_FULL_41_11]|uniref:Crossover junction endodeoxyribonuclease RuvC n=1 Tax=Candidatus Harrisonbacteria bacterium RIFCSPHIGHO2_02_FULL_42_16 TaxID=1798404 RepID=A0A1G1ZJ22_9BACT|nr:MAG: crossover junction endodeoxyribonuclease RuvC [Candidatus Harrisonbacteria bacterium RIFCSPHIGHO2_02_FULL_42_16]OGY67122.1 MAG: crossover junction endodeoxyribonuclease RuvC [Candidatus Harrisonbacteria bacterium RIFCSPLOWO2_02_FULL_41_11]
MVILGIDPGSKRVGYGLILSGKNFKLLDYGVLETKGEPAKSILEISKKVSKLLNKYKPGLAGIEKIYFSKNIKTGIAVAQTRGALMLEIAKRGIPIKELGPNEIKLAVTGYGFADKKAVSKMVAKILNLNNITGYDDASDALATAITAAIKRPDTGVDKLFR